MTSLPRLLVAALAVCAACTPAAHAADPRYDADVTVSAQEDWTYKKGGYPKDCPGWTYATGTVSAAAHARGPLIFASGGGYTVGGLSRTARQDLDVKRVIDWKIHEARTTPPCVPCGPQSELGACAPPPGPDKQDADTCAPPATEVEGLVRATFALDGMLKVEAASAPSRKILVECSWLQILPPGMPLGTPEPPLKTTRFAGAARRIERLAPGASTTFRKTGRGTSGGGRCRKTKADFQACTTFKTIMKVTRRKD